MLPAAAMSAIMRLRGNGSDFEFIADVLTDLMAIRHGEYTGSIEVEASGDKEIFGSDPPSYPNLDLDELGFVVRFANRHNFMPPGTTVAVGGFTGRMRGPFNFVPNRDGDLVIYAPNGGIDAKNIYKDGTEIVPPQEGEGCDDPGTVVMMLVAGVPTCVLVEECTA